MIHPTPSKFRQRSAEPSDSTAQRHWLRLDELNRFAWPGYDLRTIPGKPGEYAYGMLPRPLFEQLRIAILDRQKAKAPRIQARD